MIFIVARWDTSDDSLCFGMQGDDNFERTNGKCHVLR